VATDKGANAGLKVASLVAGMVAGADSIDDMAVLRHGGMGRIFSRAYAPSTLGSFLRSFTFGHVRQLDAVASRFLTGLAGMDPTPAGASDELVLVDVDDTIVQVHGYPKQGLRLPILRDPRPERPARHRCHSIKGAGDCGATAPQRRRWLSVRRRPAGRGRAENGQEPQARQAAVAAG